MADNEPTNAEQTAFNAMMSTAPAYVISALRGAHTIGKAVGLSELQQAEIAPLVAGLMDPCIAAWLLEHDLIGPGQALAITMIGSRVGSELAKADS